MIPGELWESIDGYETAIDKYSDDQSPKYFDLICTN